MSDDVAGSESLKGFGPDKWRKHYSQADNLLEEAAVTLAPFAGLTANALAHLRSDWIEWTEEFVIIRVPPKAECNQWKLEPGGGGDMPSIVQRDRPCNYCRNAGNTNRFENLWRGKKGSGGHQYTATLHRDIAEPAIDVLDRVFRDWGRPGLFAAPDSVGLGARRLVGDGDAGWCYSKLLRTGVVLYCHYGISREDITDLTPYTYSTVKQIENATPEVSRNKNNSYQYLRALADNEPTSVQKLAQEFERHENTVRNALKGLKRRNRVEVDKNGLPHMWSTVGNWSDLFSCGECDFKSPTLGGIERHEASHD